MKTYTIKPNDDLGSVAAKFGLPSWKYLYQLNQSKIGDNPDVLKEGTVLEIPQWDSTTGDEKIEEKGVSAFAYVGGTSYRYPWVPVSFTISNQDGTIYREKDANGNLQAEFQKKKKYEITDANTRNILVSGEIAKSEEIHTLVPDAKNKNVKVDDREYQMWDGDIK